MCCIGKKSFVVGFFVMILALALAASARADIIIVHGDVSGTWSADTVLVIDSIYVSAGNSLTIEPGVDVVFSQASYFRVHDGAILHAVGTETDSITFVPLNQGYNTMGLTFINSSDQSILEYCYFTRALYSAVMLQNSRITIRHCLLEYNNGYSYGGGISAFDSSDALIENNVIRNNTSTNQGGGIYCDASSPIIRGNIIDNNSVGSGAIGGGISCNNYSHPLISNNSFIGNEVTPSVFPAGQGEGGAIYCSNLSNPTIVGNLFINNRVNSGGSPGQNGGGAIFVFAASPMISNNVFAGNVAGSGNGGALYLFIFNMELLNNIFVNNSAQNYGGAIYLDISHIYVTNCILRGDTAPDGPIFYLDRSSSSIVNFCDVEGGWDGVYNIDVDPLFRDPVSNDYHLMSTECGDQFDSPCIDTGDPILHDIELNCERGLGTEISDIGAYGGGDSIFVGISSPADALPDQFSLIQNYPNPFNASTTIKFVIPHEANVTIDINDILGRKVATLINGIKSPGQHQMIWNASAYNSGIYFARLKVGEKSQTVKMVLLK
jgi:predicted outer membrane repeat protein